MVSPSELLSLLSPVSLDANVRMFPGRLSFQVLNNQFSHPEENTLQFVPLVMGSLRSGWCESLAYPGPDRLSIGYLNKDIVLPHQSAEPHDMPRLSLASALHPSDTEASDQVAAIQSIINTPRYLTDIKRVLVSSYDPQPQKDLMYKLGATMSPDFIPSEVPRPVTHAYLIAEARVTVTVNKPNQHPTQSPASLSLSTMIESGSARMAQLNLAASLSPMAYLLSTGGSILEIPMFLISDVTFVRPLPYQNWDDDVDSDTMLVEIVYNVSPAWSHAPLVHVAQRRDMSEAAYRVAPFTAYAGGGIRWAGERDVICTEFRVGREDREAAHASIPLLLHTSKLVPWSLGLPGSDALNLLPYYPSAPL